MPPATVCQYHVTPAGGVPVLVSVTPGGLHCGELLVGFPGLAGKGFTVKVAADVALPPGVVTCIVPVVPVPIVAVICVAELTTYEAAAVLPIVTAVAPVKLVPVITTVCEELAQALDGVKEVIVGGVGGVQVNVLPVVGYAVFIVLQVALLAPPAVVALSHIAFDAKLRLLKSAFETPLKPTCTL